MLRTRPTTWRPRSCPRSGRSSSGSSTTTRPGAWRVFHSRTGGLVAGDESSRLKTKKEALALARALEDMDVHGEKFDWDSPGVHDRIDRDEDGFHEALAQARDKAAADLAAKPSTPKAPVKPNATHPDGTPNTPDAVPNAPEQAPAAPEVAPALTDPRAQGVRDADRVWQHFHSDHDRARQQADQWDALAQADDDGNLTNGAERRAAAAARLRELLGDSSPPRRPTTGRMALRRRKEHHVNQYGRIAPRYWETYLPSRVAAIPPGERETFFTELGEQVAAEVATQTPGSCRTDRTRTT
jgi:hypothetical protein